MLVLLCRIGAGGEPNTTLSDKAQHALRALRLARFALGEARRALCPTGAGGLAFGDADAEREKCIEAHENRWAAINTLGRKMTTFCLIPAAFGSNRSRAGSAGDRFQGFSALTDAQRKRLEKKLTSAACAAAVKALPEEP
jgi:hypothetical protein